jgi:hypothetical protein
MQTIGSATALGALPEERGAHIAACVTDGQQGSLGMGGAQPGSIRLDGLHAFLWKREPALPGKTPAAFMSTTIAQHHTVFLDILAIAGMDWLETLQEVSIDENLYSFK